MCRESNPIWAWELIKGQTIHTLLLNHDGYMKYTIWTLGVCCFRLTGGKRATVRALKEAKRLLKENGRKKVKWTVVMITFGSPRIGRKRTVTVAQRLKKIGADMFLLAVGKKAFNNYATLKSIIRPFEAKGNERQQRLFFFRGPQHESDFMMTKAVLNIGESRNKIALLCCHLDTYHLQYTALLSEGNKNLDFWINQ